MSTVEITKQPNRYVTVTQKQNVSVVTEGADQVLEVSDPGVAGPANVLSIGTVTIANSATTPEVSITGVSPSQTLNFVLPLGGGTAVQVFTVPGVLTTGVGRGRFYAPHDLTILNVRAYLGTAPVGASVIVDVNKNGSTIFTTQANRPTITAGNNYDASSVPAITALSTGDYVTIDIDQVGTTTAGSDLSVQLEFAVR